ncbi:MAG TPA: glycosyltransferase N-terminal domain-containing protein [Ignavibacteriales bacterium]|nr:glycosyltransferase N-terminal domain-containing protein [Ignavibacteriales bacterium]HOL81681.1 glycosyltransferase N-terminal domain-containing protein [Ignavibacteriales bacterium]HOM65138.1 glycosyltransferase N-terminal domain-containing protein [Ignavibacteriales bacterium]HPD66862.1 glycosyltransferase N-terminal domain-containing protein [Ignavibacteriales bacterium]HPP33795.1 glycosyltransferase N-terminal domain-containing protein [Ignavibacteriales bacterium]
MQTIYKIIYNLLLPVLFSIFKIIGFFNKKVRDTIKARKNLMKSLRQQAKSLDKEKKIIWVHSASMGEFEQAKPLIEKLYHEGKHNIVVTFFSPSGYENQKNYKFAHLITYLPFDFLWSAKKFVSILKPDYAIITRYDLWPNILWELKKSQTQIYLIDATMKDSSPRLYPIVRNFHKYIFNQFNKIFAISEKDKRNLLKFGIKDEILEVVGDTRYDRVYQKSREFINKSLLDEKIIYNKNIMVFGSSWNDDQKNYLESLLKLHKEDDKLLSIIVPHEPTKEHISEITEKIDISYIFYSNISNYKDEKIIIVDCIGLLLALYKYAKVAFVGGSFKQGIHNVLEPAVYGIPVLYGPVIENSQEAKLLVKEGAGFVFNNNDEFYSLVKGLLYNQDKLNEIRKISQLIFENNIGATEKIYSMVKS